jgi:hypothetical protein
MSLEDVSTLTKPVQAAATIKRAKQYIATMKASNKPVDHVALRISDFDQILRAVNASRAKTPGLEPATGIRLGSVELTRGAA